MLMPKNVAVIGGSGFIGRHLVQELARQGHRVRVGVRRVDKAGFLKPMGVPGQVVPMQVNIRYPDSLAPVVTGVDVVINLVGILQEQGAQKFHAVQATGVENLAKMSKAQNVASFIQLSAIGADSSSSSQYAQSKALGEAIVQDIYPDAVIVRPSIVVGPEDQFFNRFAAMARLSPVLPLVGADTRFQPVFVGDVVKAITVAMQQSACEGIFELGGPQIYSFRELIQLMLHVTGRRALIAEIPRGLATLMASLTDWLPQAPLTRDQITLLQRDNIVSPQAQGFDDLGIKPEAIEGIIDGYLYRFRRAGQYTDLREGQ